ncbi:MAG: response regulator [Gammaproteobacteria bacterium]|nr:response regulator [Gammaproteobacteria bacterium]MBU1776449.1 response regulator [Gammaproteobacteria bacterium]MBU1968288.1 response regulator [Gammaproteobacteria bacterium]
MSTLANVFVVDDDADVREAITVMLQSAGYIVDAYSGAGDFLAHCTPDTSGCLILDVSMPDMDGPMLQAEMQNRHLKNIQIIFLSGQGTIALTAHTMRAGAMDFLTKPVDGALLLARVKEALERCADTHDRGQDALFNDARLANLTEREREVMMLAIAGLTSKEIAMRLNISYRTVETHRTRLILKTGTSNMVELAHIVAYHESQHESHRESH